MSISLVGTVTSISSFGTSAISSISVSLSSIPIQENDVVLISVATPSSLDVTASISGFTRIGHQFKGSTTYAPRCSFNLFAARASSQISSVTITFNASSVGFSRHQPTVIARVYRGVSTSLSIQSIVTSSSYSDANSSSFPNPASISASSDGISVVFSATTIYDNTTDSSFANPGSAAYSSGYGNYSKKFGDSSVYYTSVTVSSDKQIGQGTEDPGIFSSWTWLNDSYVFYAAYITFSLFLPQSVDTLLYEVVGDGGVVIGGQSDCYSSIFLESTGAGGFVLGGISSVSSLVFSNIYGNGGIILGGASNVHTNSTLIGNFSIEGSGGLVFGGSSAVRHNTGELNRGRFAPVAWPWSEQVVLMTRC